MGKWVIKVEENFRVLRFSSTTHNNKDIRPVRKRYDLETLYSIVSTSTGRIQLIPVQ